MKEIDKLIIERARISPLAFAVQTEMDKENFVAFVKAFTLDAIHDLSISQELFETENIYD